jgi:hypothetical protein
MISTYIAGMQEESIRKNSEERVERDRDQKGYNNKVIDYLLELMMIGIQIDRRGVVEEKVKRNGGGALKYRNF